MCNIQIKLTKKANTNVGIYKAIHQQKTKAQTINEMLEKYEIKCGEK